MNKRRKQKRFIIPPSYFQQLAAVSNGSSIEEKAIKSKPDEVVKVDEKPIAVPDNETPVSQEVISKYSAFSLRAIQNKKQVEQSLLNNKIDEKDKPKDAFTEEQLISLWESVISKYFKTGRMLMASNMQLAVKRLNGHILTVEFPSEGTKISFEENVYDLVNYLRKKLNNYEFQIHSLVNEKVEVKRIFTMEDKLNYLIEKHRVVEELIKTFDLTYKY